jgi:hypothetical protein
VSIPTIIRACGVATLVLLGAATSPSLRAQQAPLFEQPLDGPAIGVYAGIAGGSVDASYAVDSRGLSDATECGRYESGTSRGVLVGVQSELALSRLVGLYVGAQLAMLDAHSSYRCTDPAGTRMPDGRVATAITEFRSDASYSLATLQLGITLRPITLPFVVAFTPSLSLSSSARYSAREVIVTPAEASFVSGGQERAIGEGEFGSGDVSLAMAGSIWYEARVAERLWLVPRVGGSIALNNEIERAGLRSAAFQATLGLVYRFPAPTSTSNPIEAGQRPAERE